MGLTEKEVRRLHYERRLGEAAGNAIYENLGRSNGEVADAAQLAVQAEYERILRERGHQPEPTTKAFAIWLAISAAIMVIAGLLWIGMMQ